MAQMGTASTSMLQRRLRLGYTRAGRLIDMLERRGIISGYEGSKPRQVLITEADVPRILAHLAEGSAGARGSFGGSRGGSVAGPESPGGAEVSPAGSAPAAESPEGAETSPGGRPAPVEPPSCRTSTATSDPLQDPGRGAADSAVAKALQSVASSGHGGNRLNPPRDADARADRHQRGRGAHQDPRQVPAGDRERGLGSVARAGVRHELPQDLRRLPRG